MRRLDILENRTQGDYDLEYVPVCISCALVYFWLECKCNKLCVYIRTYVQSSWCFTVFLCY